MKKIGWAYVMLAWLCNITHNDSNKRLFLKNHRIFEQEVLRSCICFLGLLQQSTTTCLKTTEICCFIVEEARSQKPRCGQGHIPSETCKGQPFSVPLPSFWGLWGIPDIPWLAEAALHHVPRLSYGPLPHEFVSLCLFSS